ncbi:MAG: hypothetical protein OEV44_11590 [Spirochaetota bacterium]|nr:hypothetical protein [Spirochaetota bacterium]
MKKAIFTFLSLFLTLYLANCLDSRPSSGSPPDRHGSHGSYRGRHSSVHPLDKAKYFSYNDLYNIASSSTGKM